MMIPTVAAKPEIHIVISNQSNQQSIAQILYGVEEEGIPYVVKMKEITDVVSEAYYASTMSPLSVGIAVANDTAIIHYKNMPESTPLFTIKRFGALNREEQREIGCNAARLVKGIPFK